MIFQKRAFEDFYNTFLTKSLKHRYVLKLNFFSTKLLKVFVAIFLKTYFFPLSITFELWDFALITMFLLENIQINKLENNLEQRIVGKVNFNQIDHNKNIFKNCHWRIRKDKNGGSIYNHQIKINHENEIIFK